MTTPKKLNPFLSYLIFVLVFILLCFVYGAIVVTFGISRSQIHRIIVPPIIFVLTIYIRYLIVAAINKKTNQNCIQADIAAQKASTDKEPAPVPSVEPPLKQTSENTVQPKPAAPAPETHPTSEPLLIPAISTASPVAAAIKLPHILHVYIIALLLLLASISFGIYSVNNTLNNRVEVYADTHINMHDIDFNGIEEQLKDINRTIDNFRNSCGTTGTDGIEKSLNKINNTLNNSFFR